MQQIRMEKSKPMASMTSTPNQTNIDYNIIEIDLDASGWYVNSISNFNSNPNSNCNSNSNSNSNSIEISINSKATNHDQKLNHNHIRMTSKSTKIFCQLSNSYWYLHPSCDTLSIECFCRNIFC